MKEFINLLTADRIIRLGFLLSLSLQLLTLISILVFYRDLPPFIPLYNQVPWGEERLGTRAEIFLPFAISGSLFFVNIIIMALLYSRMPLVSRILSIATLLTSLLTLYFIVRTLLLIL